MNVIPVTTENTSAYIDYCQRYGAEHDESYLPSEAFVPTEEYPAYLLTSGNEFVGAVGLMRTEPYTSKGKARLTILHALDSSREAYESLTTAIRRHTEDLNSIYGFLPTAGHETRRLWEQLGFVVERYAYLLAYRSKERPIFDVPEGYSLSGLSQDDEADVRDLCDLWNSNYGHQLGFVGVTPERMTTWLGEDENIPGGALLARHGDVPVGTAYVYRDDAEPTSAEVGMLSVHPDYRGQGLGRLMLRKAVNVARCHELSPVYLSVNAENESAVSLYLSEGFVEDTAMVCYTLAVG